MVHVPYTVSTTIIADLLGGRIQASFVPEAFVQQLLADGRLRALAVSSKEPIAEPVAIPTALSQGIDYLNATWYGILASARTPKPLLKKLSEAISEVGKDPELQARIRAQSIDPRDVPLQKFDDAIQADMARIAPLLKAIAGLR
jgi:tripartite-type tricarboxylate transporter receptor subunit TctC